MQDAKVVDNACLALSRIAEAFAHKPANLNMLCEHGLITTALQLVSLWVAVLHMVCPCDTPAPISCPLGTVIVPVRFYVSSSPPSDMHVMLSCVVCAMQV